MITYKNLMRAIEALGVEMSYGIIYIGNGKLNVEDFARYVENHYIFEEYVYQSISFLHEMRQLLGNLKESSQYKQYIARYRAMMTAREFSDVNSTDEIRIYFQNTYQMLETIRKAVEHLRISMNLLIQNELKYINQEYVVGIAILVILFIISPIMIVLVRNAVNALQVFSENVKSKARELRREKRRAETLVYQMLPKTVADNLRLNRNRPYSDV